MGSSPRARLAAEAFERARSLGLEPVPPMESGTGATWEKTFDSSGDTGVGTIDAATGDAAIMLAGRRRRFARFGRKGGVAYYGVPSGLAIAQVRIFGPDLLVGDGARVYRLRRDRGAARLRDATLLAEEL